ncbi:hypothetical protein RUND412_000028 [Rhizina undulata]
MSSSSSPTIPEFFLSQSLEVEYFLEDKVDFTYGTEPNVFQYPNIKKLFSFAGPSAELEWTEAPCHAFKPFSTIFGGYAMPAPLSSRPVAKANSVALSCPEKCRCVALKNLSADIEVRNLTDIICGGKLESLVLFQGNNPSTIAQISFWDIAGAQSYMEVFKNKQLIIGGTEEVDNQRATRAFTVRGFAATVEEFDCFKIRFEKFLELSEITDLDVESVRIMQFENKKYFNAVFKFGSISAAKTVKDAMEVLGYVVIYDMDPCEGSVEELSDDYGLVELVEFADI